MNAEQVDQFVYAVESNDTITRAVFANAHQAVRFMAEDSRAEMFMVQWNIRTGEFKRVLEKRGRELMVPE